MKCVCYFYIHHINILYTYGRNHSLYNNVMNICLIVYQRVRSIANYIAIFSESGGQMFCLFSFDISFNGIKFCDLFDK